MEWNCSLPGLEGAGDGVAGTQVGARARGAVFGFMPLGDLAPTQQLD